MVGGRDICGAARGVVGGAGKAKGFDARGWIGSARARGAG